jgi:hypothetical protein
MRIAFVVTIEGGLFRDKVISLARTIDGAVRDGLRHYKKIAARPHLIPAIKAERMIVVSTGKR